jgi:hypothetical protein
MRKPTLNRCNLQQAHNIQTNIGAMITFTIDGREQGHTICTYVHGLGGMHVMMYRGHLHNSQPPHMTRLIPRARLTTTDTVHLCTRIVHLRLERIPRHHDLISVCLPVALGVTPADPAQLRGVEEPSRVGSQFACEGPGGEHEAGDGDCVHCERQAVTTNGWVCKRTGRTSGRTYLEYAG